MGSLPCGDAPLNPKICISVLGCLIAAQVVRVVSSMRFSGWSALVNMIGGKPPSGVGVYCSVIVPIDLC